MTTFLFPAVSCAHPIQFRQAVSDDGTPAIIVCLRCGTWDYVDHSLKATQAATIPAIEPGGLVDG